MTKLKTSRRGCSTCDYSFRRLRGSYVTNIQSSLSQKGVWVSHPKAPFGLILMMKMSSRRRSHSLALAAGTGSRLRSTAWAGTGSVEGPAAASVAAC